MISAGWRWHGQKKIHTVSVLDDRKRFKRDYSDDFHVVSSLRDAVAEADIIVGHNINGFDTKHLRRKVLLHDLEPIPPVKAVDTLTAARSAFNFPFNSLAEIAKELGCEQKDKVNEKDWFAAAWGCEKAIKKIVKYMKQDVIVSDDIFTKLRPHLVNYPNLNSFIEEGLICDRCQSYNMKEHKKRVIAGGQLKIQFQCQDCGGYKTPNAREMKKWTAAQL
jgi:hypothetical protein